VIEIKWRGGGLAGNQNLLPRRVYLTPEQHYDRSNAHLPPPPACQLNRHRTCFRVILHPIHSIVTAIIPASTLK
jgi:hypothetical protein